MYCVAASFKVRFENSLLKIFTPKLACSQVYASPFSDSLFRAGAYAFLAFEFCHESRITYCAPNLALQWIACGNH